MVDLNASSQKLGMHTDFQLKNKWWSSLLADMQSLSPKWDVLEDVARGAQIHGRMISKLARMNSCWNVFHEARRVEGIRRKESAIGQQGELAAGAPRPSLGSGIGSFSCKLNRKNS